MIEKIFSQSKPEEVEASPITYKINRESLISLIKCAIDDTSCESLINPMVAVKIIGLVFLFKHHQPVSMEVVNKSVHVWYKATITDQPITPFNCRKKASMKLLCH